jgi:3-methyladenine DNA glycosylase AlkC
MAKKASKKKTVAKKAATVAKVSGPLKVADVPRETIDAIHRGERSTRNLVEALAIDPFVVAENFLASIDKAPLCAAMREAKSQQPKWTLPKAVLTIGVAFESLRAAGELDDSNVVALVQHPSDIVRSFACFAVAMREKRTLPQRLKVIQPLAADEHFGVRELAWMAFRPYFAADLDTAIRELAKWSKHRDANLRRFASEATRPRGVWCSHIDELKRHPEQALPILEPLKADPSEYVRASVGNWLNDASKSRPDFVRDLCERWSRESSAPETEAICKRALRTLAKS